MSTTSRPYRPTLEQYADPRCSECGGYGTVRDDYYREWAQCECIPLDLGCSADWWSSILALQLHEVAWLIVNGETAETMPCGCEAGSCYCDTIDRDWDAFEDSKPSSALLFGPAGAL